MLDVSASCACDCEDGNVPDNRAQYRARASVINLRKTRVGAAVSAANAVILLHEGDVEASTITTWMRLIAPLDRPITVEVCIGGRLRSEEHTSELQSLMRISYAVFCLKKNITTHK